MRGLWFTLFAFASLAAKEPTAFTMHADGFVTIHTLTLTAGTICRKLDRFESPEPLTWHTKPAWNALYLAGISEQKNESEKAVPNPTSCQRAISHRTLVGPLKKGEWQIYGASAEIGKMLLYTKSREIKPEKGAFTFTTEKPAVLAVDIHRFGNSTGRCREYVPMLLNLKSDQTINVVLKPHSLQINETDSVCRAMPQMHSNTTLELAPGAYKLTGETPKTVMLYAAE